MNHFIRNTFSYVSIFALTTGFLLAQGWQGRSDDYVERLNDVHFPTATTGYAVGNAGVVLKTETGNAVVTETSGTPTWESENTGISADVDLVSVHFTTTSKGFAVGNPRGNEDKPYLYKTENGGAMWTRVEDYGTNDVAVQAAILNGQFSAVYFQNTTAGYIVGGTTTAGTVGEDGVTPTTVTPIVLFTTNAGDDWRDVTNASISGFVVDVNAGVAGTGGIANIFITRQYNSVRGVIEARLYEFTGTNFAPLFKPAPVNPRAVALLQGAAGPRRVTVHAAGRRTVAVGETRASEPPIYHGRVNFNTAADASTDLVPSSFTINRFDENGVFTHSEGFQPEEIYDIDGYVITTSQGNHGSTVSLFAVGAGGTIATTSASSTLAPPPTASTAQGWRVQTKTDGTPWTNRNLYGLHVTVAASDDIRTHAVGEGGLILYRAGRSNDWVPQREASLNLHDVAFLSNGKTGFSVGENGTFRKTTDAGVTWADVTYTRGDAMPNDKDLNAIFFYSDDSGFVAGEDGVYFTTSDGGVSWVQRPEISNFAVNDLHFVDAINGGVRTGAVGIAVDDAGNVYRTEDPFSDSRGAWEQVWFASRAPLFGVDFANSFVGWAVGAQGLFLQTNDGGKRWEAVNMGLCEAAVNGLNCEGQTPTFIDFTLYDVHLESAISGYVVGEGGNILRTVNGGTAWFDAVGGNVLERNAGDGKFVVDGDGNLITRSVEEDFYKFAVGGPTKWAVGAEGTILAQYGGDAWELLPSGTTESLRSVVVGGSDSVYVVGHSGTSLRTASAGLRYLVLSASNIRITGSAAGTVEVQVYTGPGVTWTAEETNVADWYRLSGTDPVGTSSVTGTGPGSFTITYEALSGTINGTFTLRISSGTSGQSDFLQESVILTRTMDDASTPTVTFSPARTGETGENADAAAYVLEAASGLFLISVTMDDASSTSWSVTSDEDWLEPEGFHVRTTDATAHTLEVYYDKNSTDAERTAMLTFQTTGSFDNSGTPANSIPLHVKQAAPSLTVDETAFNAIAAAIRAGTTLPEIEVTSNTEWTVTNSVPWLPLRVKSDFDEDGAYTLKTSNYGVGDGRVKIPYWPNNLNAERSGSITFRADGVDDIRWVFAQAANDPEVNIIGQDDSERELVDYIGPRGGSVTVMLDASVPWTTSTTPTTEANQRIISVEPSSGLGSQYPIPVVVTYRDLKIQGQAADQIVTFDLQTGADANSPATLTLSIANGIGAPLIYDFAPAPDLAEDADATAGFFKVSDGQTDDGSAAESGDGERKVVVSGAYPGYWVISESEAWVNSNLRSPAAGAYGVDTLSLTYEVHTAATTRSGTVSFYRSDANGTVDGSALATFTLHQTAGSDGGDLAVSVSSSTPSHALISEDEAANTANYAASGGTLILEVNSANSWYATSDASWLKLRTVPTGESVDEHRDQFLVYGIRHSAIDRINYVRLVVEGNDGVQRVGSITVQRAGVEDDDKVTYAITQAADASAAADPFIAVVTPIRGQRTIYVPNANGNFELDVAANVNWTATAVATWLTPTPAAGDAGVGGTRVIVRYTEDQSVQTETTGLVTFDDGADGADAVTIMVKRAAGDGTVTPAITPTVDPATLTNQGEAVSGNAVTGLVTGGGTFEIDVAVVPTTTAWTLMSDGAWLTVSSSGETGNAADVTVTYAENTGAARSATLTFSPLTSGVNVSDVVITVNQLGTGPTLTAAVDDDSLPGNATLTNDGNVEDMPIGGGTFDIEVTVTGTTTWSVASTQTWATIAPMTGTATGDVTVTLAQNMGFRVRTTTLEFTGTGGVAQVDIDVEQDGVTLTQMLVAGSLGAGVTTSTLPHGGGTFEISVSSNVDWTASNGGDEWVTFEDALGATLPATIAASSTPTVVTVRYAAHRLAATRSADFTFRGAAPYAGVSAGRAITQLAAPEKFEVNGMTDAAIAQTVGKDATTSMVSVDANVAWTVTGATGFVTAVSPLLGDGSAVVDVMLTFSANDTGAEREATFTFNATVSNTSTDIVLTLTQSADAATLSAAVDAATLPTGATLTNDGNVEDMPSVGGTFEVSVTSNVSWRVSSGTDAWVTFRNEVNTADLANEVTGNVTLTVVLAPNTSISERTATIIFTDVGGEVAVGDLPSIDITQDGAAAMLGAVANAASLVSPITLTTLPAVGGAFRVDVTGNVTWTVSSGTAAWLTFEDASGTAVTGDTGAKQVTVAYAANTGVARDGTITFATTQSGVADVDIDVTQLAGTAPPVTPTLTAAVTESTLPTGATETTDGDVEGVPLAGGTFDVAVTITGTVAWTAASDETWATLSSASGSANATVTVTIAANTGAERTATLTFGSSTLGVNDVVITVEQDGEVMTSIDARDVSGLQIYPNPTGSGVSVASASVGELRVYGSGGRLLAVYAIEGGETHQIDLSGYDAGVYVLELVSGQGSVHRRVVRR